MRHCPSCQVVYEDEARFCPADGTPLLAPTDPHIGRVFLGQFEIREVCGRGSMGTVYRAWQRSMEREVAIKVLRSDLLRDPRIVKRFRREAKTSARLSHPSIITVYTVGDTDEGVPFLAMEFVKGRSLDQVLVGGARLSPARTINIARQIASALAEAHCASVVHRDLKPENIFLCETAHTVDFVKILDFGIAKVLHAQDESLLTQAGAIFGTPYYISPEQASGDEVDHRCDLYALGVILFRMLTGRLPFDSDSGMGVLIQHLREAPPRPSQFAPGLPAALEELVLRALAKSPALRWPTARDMERALAAIIPQLPSATLSDDEASGVLLTPDAIPSANSPPALGAAPRAVPPVATQSAPVVRSPAAPPSTPPAAPCPEPAPVAAGRSTPEASAATTASGADSTLTLARLFTSRRRLLTHLLLACGSVLGGAAIGAALYWSETPPPSSELIPSLPPPGGLDAGQQLTAGRLAAVPTDAGVCDRAKPPPARQTRAVPRRPAGKQGARPTEARRVPRAVVRSDDHATPPERHDPSLLGSDHAEETTAGARTASPDAAPMPPGRNEPLYDLLE